MKRCCIIGGSGFIGSHIAWLLKDKNYSISVIGRKNKPVRDLPAGTTYFQGDYSDSYFLESVLSKSDAVIHLAYTTTPKTSFDDPVKDILENLPSTVRLFEVVLKCKISKLIMLSSGGTVYGDVGEIPLTEISQTNPISPYGITKLVTEKYALMYHKIYNLPIICLRPGNAYGEWQIPFSGQGFIATSIASILTNKEITLFGDGNTVRDYLYIQDMACGIISALESGINGNIYNLGSGVGKSNNDILNILKELAQKLQIKVKINSCASRKFDVPVNILESSKLTKHTGWSPKIGFNDGLLKTWDWYVKNIDKVNKH